ncbi:MAG: hypothetical protein A2X35_11270 [Elusimicrobia bacterium GWA2_61_42]|nr:MAG: hypothetical protein A2X35_11270 [Elusimicrobia bacterium GWA2_61_42]OGR75880.1 MAG: hypothetical protein A2X38_07645 [Elusimicrobia bacterium GWC2_61_25]
MKSRHVRQPGYFLKGLALCACIAVLFAGIAGAVPANPRPRAAAQPDGTKITIALKGDEYHHWNEDAAGYTVLKDKATRNWVYAEKDPSGALRPGLHKVGAADPEKLGFTKRLLDERKVKAGAARRVKTETARRAKASASSPSRVSSSQATVSGLAASPAAVRTPILTGTMRNLVILAKFSNQGTVYTQPQFNSLFNDAGYSFDGAAGSVKDYYTQVSYGQLTVQSGVSAWVNLPQTAAYYGANDVDGWDLRPKQMVIDAINALDASGFDFSAYDGNADGEVDGLTIIHSGRAEEWDTNDPDYIWSHQWELDAPLVKDGVSMQMYHTEAEMRGWDGDPAAITRIGVIAHETGHFLGLPDLYDTDGGSSGLGQFCLMSGGSWNGNYGSSPAHFSAWPKKYLGWATATRLTTIGTKPLSRIEDNAAALYLLQDSAFPADEYFLVENRQGYGFDSQLPGSSRGILIWHVDESRSGNTDPAHYLVDLEEASGTQHLTSGTNVSGDDADYFRQGNNTTFSDTTSPNSKTYTAASLKLPISAVSASAAAMTFYLGTTDITQPAAVATVKDGLGDDIAQTGSLTQLSANWTAASDPETGISGYKYAIGTAAGSVNVADWTDNGAAQSVTRGGLTLTAGTVYYFGVKAVNGVGVESAVQWSNGQQVDISFPSDIPYVYDGLAEDIDYAQSLNTLSANWGASAAGGVLEYQYAIGTTPGGTERLGWTTAGLNTSITKPGLVLAEGATYYFAVKARNANGFSSAVASDGQRVDTVAPSAKVEIFSALPAKTGPFSAKLIITEAGALAGEPVLRLAFGCGAGTPMAITYTVASTWTVTAFVESYFSTGTACFTFSATDLAGNTGTLITGGNSFDVDPAVAGAGGGTISNSDGTSVTIPAGAYAGNLYVTISTIPASRTETADSGSRDSVKLLSSDLVKEFRARSAAGAPVTSFSSPVTIRLGYPDANDDGHLDGDFIREDLAWLYYLNEATGKWEPQENVVRDRAANTVSAQTSHFSVYSVRVSIAAGQGLSGLKAYPNPCDFRGSASLNIAGIPLDASNPRVYIYNEAGELVRTLTAGSGIDAWNSAAWDGRLPNGAKAASGLYIYLVKTDNYGKGKGKFFALW